MLFRIPKIMTNQGGEQQEFSIRRRNEWISVVSRCRLESATVGTERLWSIDWSAKGSIKLKAAALILHWLSSA